MWKIKYRLMIKDRLHSGTGISHPGFIDDFSHRDRHGFPEIPASHIKGLLRSSCFSLLDMTAPAMPPCRGQIEWQTGKVPKPQDYCSSQEKSCPICTLFGSPRRLAGILVSPARFPSDYREKIQQMDWVGNDQVLQPQASIDPMTLRAKDQHLFIIETVRPTSYFEGSIQVLDVAEPESDLSLAGLLIASILFTRRIGGKRSRGWGKCRFQVEDPSFKDTTIPAASAIDAWLKGIPEEK